MNKEKLNEIDDIDEVKSFNQSDIYVLIQTLVNSCARLLQFFFGGHCDIIKFQKNLENLNQGVSGVSVCLL